MKSEEVQSNCPLPPAKYFLTLPFLASALVLSGVGIACLIQSSRNYLTIKAHCLMRVPGWAYIGVGIGSGVTAIAVLILWPEKKKPLVKKAPVEENKPIEIPVNQEKPLLPSVENLLNSLGGHKVRTIQFITKTVDQTELTPGRAALAPPPADAAAEEPLEELQGRMADSVFCFLHAGHMGLNPEGLVCDPHQVRRCLVSDLQEVLDRTPADHDDRAPITLLLETWQRSILLETAWNPYHNSPAHFPQQARFWLSELQQQGRLSLAIRWSQEGTGHTASLVLEAEEREGQWFVSGTFFNKGEGAENHAFTHDAQKEKIVSRLELSEVPIENLESSHFLIAVQQLQMSQTLTPEELQDLPSAADTLHHTVQDIYDVLLAQWPHDQPGWGVRAPQDGPFRTPLQGSVDTASALITEIKTALGECTGRRVKLELELTSLQRVIDKGHLSDRKYSYIQQSIDKMYQSVQKLGQSGYLNDDEITDKSVQLNQLRARAKEAYENGLNDILVVDALDFDRPLTSDQPPISNSLPPMGAILLDKSQRIELPEGFDPTDLSMSLEEGAKIAAALVDKRPVDARLLATGLLDRLEGVTHSRWDTVCDDATLDAIRSLIDTLIATPTIQQERLHYTPDVATLLLKALAISLQQFSSAESTPNKPVTRFYLFQALDLINHMLDLKQRNNTATRMSEYRESVDFIHDLQKRLFNEYRWSGKPPSNSRTNRTPEGHLYWNGIRFEDNLPVNKHPELLYIRNHKREDGERHAPSTIIGGLCSHFSSEDSLPAPYAAMRRAYMSMLFATRSDGQVSQGGSKPKLTFSLYPDEDHIRHYRRDNRGASTDWHSGVRDQNFIISVSVSDVYFTEIDDMSLPQGYGHDSLIPLVDRHSDNSKHSAILLTGHRTITRSYQKNYFEMEYFSEHDDRSLPKEQNKQIATTSKVAFTPKGEKPFSDYLLTDLQAIHLSEDLFIPQLVFTFNKHFHRLNSPVVQGFLAADLYTKNAENRLLIDVAIEKFPRLKKQLWQFLQEGVHKSRRVGWVDTAVYFLRLQAQVLACWKCCGYDTKKEEAQLKKHLKGFVTKKADSPEDRAKICYAIVALAPYIQTMPHLVSLCLAAFQELKTENYAPQEMPAAQIEQDFEKGNAVLTAIFNKQGGYIVEGLISSSIIQHPDYRAVYGSSNFPTIVITAEKQWQFTDHLGFLCQVSVDDDHQVSLYRDIEMDGTTTRCQYSRTPLTLSSAPGNQALINQYSLWVSSEAEQKAFLLCPKTGRVLYSITEGNLVAPGTSPTRRLVDAGAFDPSFLRTVSRIASPKDILSWADLSEETLALTQVDLPAYGLQFTQSDKTSRWECEQHPGYYLDTHQEVKAFAPYCHYLVLRNASGKRRVIISDATIAHHRPALDTSATLPHGGEGKHLLAYDLDSKGEIITPFSPYPCLYLAYLAFMRQDYAGTQRLLCQLEAESAEWDAATAELATRFDAKDPNTADHHPVACALRMRLKLLLSKYAEDDSINRNALERDYRRYREQPNSTLGYRLTLKEEQDLINRFGISQNRSHRKMTHLHGRFGLNFDWLQPQHIQTMRVALDTPYPLASDVRPGAPFIANFLYYYAIARLLPVDHPLHISLKKMLELSRHSPGAEIQALHAALVRVAYAPNRNIFPDLDDLLEGKNDQEIIASIQALCPQRAITFPLEWRLQNLYTDVPVTGVSQENLGSRPLEVTGTDPNEIALNTHPLSPTSICYLEELREKGLVEDDTISYKERLSNNLEGIKNLIEGYRAGEQAEAEKGARPAVEQEFTKNIEGLNLEKDRLTKEIDTETPHYCLDSRKVASLKTFITAKQTSLMDFCKDAETDILALVNPSPGIRGHLEQGGRLLPRATLRDLIVLYGKNTFAQVLRFNSHLSAEQVQYLYGLVGTYLVNKTQEQLLVRTLEKLGDLEEPAPEDLAAAYDLLTAPRAYEAAHPTVLAFECLTDIRLRQDQYDALKKLSTDLASGEDAAKNFELEARTGFGKSKVLIPLWLMLSVQASELTMMAVPTALFQDQLAHLRNLLGRNADLHIVSISFDRNRANDVVYLEKLRAKIQAAGDQKKILLTDIHSLHGMTNLKVQEVFCEEAGAESTAQQKLLLGIRKQCSNAMEIFFDESRQCFSIRHRYDYAIGDTQVIPQDKVEAITTLYDILFFQGDQDFLDDWHFDFLPQGMVKTRAKITESLYEQELLFRFAAKVAAYFKLCGDEPYYQAILNDLQGHYTEACDEFYHLLSEDKLKEYNWYRNQLNIYLKRTLCRQCNENYGLPPAKAPLPNEWQRRLAYPFVDSALRQNSEFIATDDQINFTLQANLRTPFTLSDIQNLMMATKAAIIACEVEQRPIDHDPMGRAYEALRKICPTILPRIAGIATVTPDDEKKCLKALNKSTGGPRLRFASALALSQATIYEKKISSSSHEVAIPFKKAHAASGTTQKETMPDRFTPSATPTATVPVQLALSRASVVTLDHAQGKTARQRAIENFESTLNTLLDHRALSDVASLFRDIPAKKMAEIIFNKMPANGDDRVDGVCYYDAQGRCWVLERGKKKPIPSQYSSVPPQHRFVVFRQANTVGADQPMPSSTKMIVTCSSTTTKDALLQGGGRARLLSQGQTLTLLVAAEDTADIRTTLKKGPNAGLVGTDLLVLVTKNQGIGTEKDGLYNLQRKLEAQLKNIIFKYAHDHSEDIEQVQKMFEDFEGVLTENTKEGKLPGFKKNLRSIDIKIAVPNRVKAILKPWRDLIEQKRLDGYIAVLDKIQEDFLVKVDYTLLPQQANDYDTSDGICDVEADRQAVGEVAVVGDVDQIADEILDGEGDNTVDNLIDQQDDEDLFQDIEGGGNSHSEPVFASHWGGNYTDLRTGDEWYNQREWTDYVSLNPNSGERFTPPVPKKDWLNFASLPKLYKCSSLLGISLRISNNFYCTTYDKKKRKPAYSFILIRQGNRLSYAPLSVADAEQALKALTRKHYRLERDGASFYLFAENGNSTAHLLASDTNPGLETFSLNDIERFPDLRSVHILRKIYTRHTSLTEEELSYLNQYFADDPEGKEKKRFIKELEILSRAWPATKNIIKQIHSLNP